MPQIDFDGANSLVKTDKIQGQGGTTVTVPTGHTVAITDADRLTIAGTAVKAGALGKVLQVVNVTDSAVATGTTQIPSDDTIPQNTEGNELMTLAITPTNSSNILLIQGVVQWGHTNAGEITLGLFQDSTANALMASSARNTTVNTCNQVPFFHRMVAGTTSSTTFKIRVGNSNVNTLTFNGVSSGRKFGGVHGSSITIMEISA